MDVRVLQFDNEAAAEKCLLYIHCRGLGDMTSFRSAYPADAVIDATGIERYSANQWSTVDECKSGDGASAWAIPMNDARIDAVLNGAEALRDEFQTIFSGVEFSIVDSAFWRIPE